MRDRPITTIYVHGVGMWPSVFDRVTARLPGPHLIWIRPGYDRSIATSRFENQVAALAEVIEREQPARVVGVSGGATVGLACAMGQPPGLVGLLTHEPLIGPLERDLHRRVSEAGQRLRRNPGPEAAIGFLRGLYGRSWDHIPEPGRRWAAERHDAVCREVRHFAAFAPTVDDLAGIHVPHLTTVGADSASDRHRVAKLLSQTGATVEVLDGTSHLPPIDNPGEFARAVGDQEALHR